MSQKRQALPKSVLTPYTGGHTVLHGPYIFELCPDHPKANPFGFVAQHRLVVERHLGYYLAPGLQVHHRDEVKTNNALSNLQVLTRSEHRRIHCELERTKKTGPLVRETVRQALLSGGLKKAAAQLFVHTETIRNLFPDLVAPYKRRSPARIDDPVTIAKVLAVAPSDKKGYRDVALETGISYMTARRICERAGVAWNPKDVPLRPGRPPGTSKILNNPDLVDRIRELASDPRYSRTAIAKEVGISEPSVVAVLNKYQIPWVHASKAGYKHKNPRSLKVRNDPSLIARVRLLADDPDCGYTLAVEKLGVCARTIRQILSDQGIEWVSAKTGERIPLGRQRRKPTRRGSEVDASRTEPDDQRQFHLEDAPQQ
jgi:hypothetical protein